MGALDLKALAPVLEPMLLQVLENVVVPAIQKEIDAMTSPDLKVVAQSFLPAVQAVLEYEIKQLAK